MDKYIFHHFDLFLVQTERKFIIQQKKIDENLPVSARSTCSESVITTESAGLLVATVSH